MSTNDNICQHFSLKSRIFVPWTFYKYHFGPRVYPRGSYVITHVRPWSVVRGPWSMVHGRSVFKYLRDRSKDFSNFLHEVRVPYGYKSDRARFLKKNCGGRKWGKTPIFGSFLVFFVHISKMGFSPICDTPKFFFKNQALSLLYPYGTLTSCKK